jgi:hypothetical protein
MHAVQFGKADIKKNQIGFQFGRFMDCFHSIACLTDDLKPAILFQR